MWRALAFEFVAVGRAGIPLQELAESHETREQDLVATMGDDFVCSRVEERPSEIQSKLLNPSTC